MKSLWVVLLLVSCSPCPSYALDNSASGKEWLFVRCILGEAEGESLEGQTAVGEAIRNRIALMGENKALKGVFGCKAVKEEKGVFRRGDRVIPKYAVKRAFKAVSEASTSNLVKGADHWESTDFKRPSWSKNMILTATIGKHEYFKESK